MLQIRRGRTVNSYNQWFSEPHKQLANERHNHKEVSLAVLGQYHTVRSIIRVNHAKCELCRRGCLSPFLRCLECLIVPRQTAVAERPLWRIYFHDALAYFVQMEPRNDHFLASRNDANDPNFRVFLQRTVHRLSWKSLVR